MNDTDVLVVGAGPTGLALGASLTAHGVRTVLVDALAEGQNTTRAAAVNARTLEVLEDLDVARRMVKAGLIAPRFTMREGRQILVPVDFSRLPTKHPYTLMLSQADTERLLLERLHELGGEVIRPKALSRLTRDADGVTATFDDGETIRAGEGIILDVAPANWDSRQFPNPDRLELQREDGPHVGFGYGRHQCVGQQLARMELQTVLPTLLRRVPTLRLAVPVEKLPFKHDTLAYGVYELPVAW